MFPLFQFVSFWEDAMRTTNQMKMSSTQQERDIQDFALDIEDYSGRNFDTDVLDTIVESSHSDLPIANEKDPSDEILDEDHWTSDSFEPLEIEKEY